MEDNKMKLTIEELRQQLLEMIKEKGISDTSVLALSQKLDTYIVQYQLQHLSIEKCSGLEPYSHMRG